MATADRERSNVRRAEWRLSVLGPVEIYLGGRRVEVQGVARSVLALLTRVGRPGRQRRDDGGRAVGLPAAGRRRAGGRLVRLPPAQGARPTPAARTPPPWWSPARRATCWPSNRPWWMSPPSSSCVAEGRRALGIGQPALAARRLRDALALWRGEAYADVAEAAFAPAEARRLGELRLAAVESRIEAELAAAAPTAPAALVGELQLLVGRAPAPGAVLDPADHLPVPARASRPRRSPPTSGPGPGWSRISASSRARSCGRPSSPCSPATGGSRAARSRRPPSRTGCPVRCRAASAATRNSPGWRARSTRRPRPTARPAWSSGAPASARPASWPSSPTGHRCAGSRSGTAPAAALNALVAEPDRLQLVILDDVDNAGLGRHGPGLGLGAGQPGPAGADRAHRHRQLGRSASSTGCRPCRWCR